MMVMGSPGVEGGGYKAFENTKLQITLLCVGVALIALGIALMCVSTNVGVHTLGSIFTTIGTPLVLYGIIGLIYNKCMHQVKSEKVERREIQPSTPPVVEPRSEQEKAEMRRRALEAAAKRND